VSLILPNGIRPKTVGEIGREEMAWLAMGEDVLRKLKMTIVCTRCKEAVWGQNDSSDHTMQVTCGCRRLTYRARPDAGA
jgi:hypothetical protein